MVLKTRILVLSLVIVGLVWLASGDSDYEFCTQAEYEAPEMGFRIRMAGVGVVEAGDDLSNGYTAMAVVCPTAGTGKPIRLTRTGQSTAEYSITDGESVVLEWDFRNKPKALVGVFRSAGFGHSSDGEIAETMHVFENVSYGPKGTTMLGQTKFLKAKLVDFQGDRCEEQTPKKWMEQTALALDCSS